jgi:hypothetical protein
VVDPEHAARWIDQVLSSGTAAGVAIDVKASAAEILVSADHRWTIRHDDTSYWSVYRGALPTPPDALANLKACCCNLAAALAHAAAARADLTGAREARANELGYACADALDFAHRLATVVEGDVRADEQRHQGETR